MPFDAEPDEAETLDVDAFDVSDGMIADADADKRSEADEGPEEEAEAEADVDVTAGVDSDADADAEAEVVDFNEEAFDAADAEDFFSFGCGTTPSYTMTV